MNQRLQPVRYELEFDGGPDAEWKVFRFHLDEAVNRPYRASIDLATESEDTDTEALLGLDASLTISRAGGACEYLYGLVVQVDYLGFADHRLCIRVHLRSAFELLRQRLNSRISQSRSVGDIVAEVLAEPFAELGRRHAASGLERGQSTRDYCVQYRESDFDYVSRLLEEEGISYMFVHPAGEGRELLTLRDANSQYPAIEDEHGPIELPIIAHANDEADTESLYGFEWIRALESTASVRRDFDWRRPKEALTSPATGADERGRVRRRYVHGHRRYIEDDLAIRSADDRDAQALGGRLARGRSNATSLRPGHTFKLVHHEREDLADAEYIITQVTHQGHCSDIADIGAVTGPRYDNEFECVPVDSIIRPRARTPKPRMHGPQTATVTGEAGDDIYTDEHGRVQVQFHWEEQPSYTHGSSCWIRVAQTLAGPAWGAQFIPRVGMEVVVDFLEGNPDRPLIMGCVYNGQNPPPFTLPDRKTQSGWRTSSSPSGKGANELRFDDAAGSEEVYLHGQKNWNIAIENDKTKKVGQDERSRIGHDQCETIVHDQSLEVGRNQTVKIAGRQKIDVTANRVESVGGNHTQSISGLKTVTVQKMCSFAVGGAHNVIVAGAITQSAGAAMITTVGLHSTENVMANKTVSANDIRVAARGQHTLTAKKDMQLKTAKDLMVDATKAATFKSGMAMKFETKHQFAVEAEDHTIIHGKKVGKIVFDKKLVLKCGAASITLEKNGDIKLKGKNIRVSGTGEVDVKGGKVNSN